MFEIASPYPSLTEYLDALMARTSLLRQWLLLLEQYPVILAPQQAGPLMTVDEDMQGEQQLRQLWAGFAPSITVNLLGLPSVLVPTGLRNGLPIGVRLIAGRYREDVCLAAAEEVEHRVGTLLDQLWERMRSE